MVKYLRLDNYWTDWTTFVFPSRQTLEAVSSLILFVTYSLNANQFYLPVNRTRGYLVAVAGSLSVSANPQRLELAEKAIRRVKKLQHRPTVPVDAFALPRREAVSEEEKADGEFRLPLPELLPLLLPRVFRCPFLFEASQLTRLLGCWNRTKLVQGRHRPRCLSKEGTTRERASFRTGSSKDDRGVPSATRSSGRSC